MKRALLIVAAAALTLLSSACGPVDIQSRWRTAEIKIDGRADDWEGALRRIEDSPVSVGVANDDQYVYICLQVQDPRVVAPLLRRGLVVWFDPAGGQDRVLGLKFPIGLRRDDGQDRFETPGGRADGRGPRIDQEDVEILGPGRDEFLMLKKDDLKGVEVAQENDNGHFVYEIKMPLAKSGDAPYAAGSAPGRSLGVGFEPAADTAGRRRGMRGISGGYGPGYGGRGGMMGPGGLMGRSMGRGYGGGGEFKLWMNVALAKPAR
jgi:hypothetical protein